MSLAVAVSLYALATLIAWAFGLSLAPAGLLTWASAGLLLAEIRDLKRQKRVAVTLSIRLGFLLLLLCIGVVIQTPGMSVDAARATPRLLWQASIVYPFLFGSMYVKGLGKQATLCVFALPLFLLAFTVVRAPAQTTPEAAGIDWHYECHTLTTPDGTRLDTLRFPAPGSSSGPEARGVVVLVHGLGAEKCQFLPAVAPLRASGFEVWTYDQRGHGGSGGFMTSLGRLEAADLATVWRSARAAVPPDRPGLIYGVSLGGAAAQIAANGNKLEQLDGLILDSTFATLRGAGARRLPWVGEVLYDALDSMRLDAVVLGRRILNTAPIVSIKSSGPPVAILHLDKDPVIPVSESRQLAAAYGPRASLHVLEGDLHAASAALDPTAHERAVRALASRATASSARRPK